MKLRFEVDQAEAFRRGIDCPKSIISLEVNPAEVPIETRELIAKRMHGIDVCQLIGGKPAVMIRGADPSPLWIKAALPTWEEFLAAVKKDEARVLQEECQQKGPRATSRKLARELTPDANYQHFRERLHVLMNEAKEENMAMRDQIRKRLREEFVAAFELELDKGKVTQRLKMNLENKRGEFAQLSNFLDHSEYFRRGDDCVIVSQPYGFRPEHVESWRKATGARVTLASEWGYYYPIKADLLIIEFSPEAKAALERKLRAD